MSRSLVALPATAARALAERIQISHSAEGLEQFDLLADGSTVEQALRTALGHPAAVRALVLAAAAPPSDPGLVERFAALKIPTLVLLGTRDAQVPPETGRRWRALLPASHIVLIYDAAHELAVDRPQAFADIVSDFLSDPGAFLVNRRSGALQP